MYDISLSIVAYHNYKEIIEAIDSIENETAPVIKKIIYIVDNSNEDSEELKKFLSYVEKYKDVEYLNTKCNLGFGKGHNYVLNKIDSRYHAIVNPDIILTEDSLDKIISFMDKNKSIGLCVPRMVDSENRLLDAYREYPTVFDMFIRYFCRKLFPKRIAKHSLKYMDFGKSFKIPFAQGSFLVIDTNLFKKINGFDDGFFMYLEDADLCRRVNEESKVVYFPGTTVIHKWNKGSHKSIKLFFVHIKSMIWYFKKWGIKWI